MSSIAPAMASTVTTAAAVNFQVSSRISRAVAEEIAADPNYAEEEPIGPDADARERFREFAKRQLGSP